MLSLAEDRHEKALRAWWRWCQTKRQRDRDAAIFELWFLCEPEIWHAVGELAEKLGEATERHITIPKWRLLHGLEEDDVRYTAFPAVAKAAKGYDPHAGASFQTYAYSFILGELRSSIATGDALNISGELTEFAESEETAEEQLDMWSLFELDQHNGGLGKYSDRGAILRSLDADTLEATKTWLERNGDRAIEHYGYNRWRFLLFNVNAELWYKRMPEDVRRFDPFADRPKYGLPLQGVAIRTDGKTWDLDLVIRAEILRRQGLSGRAIAERLGRPESSLRKIQKRAKELGFSLSSFTPHELDAIACGKKRGRPNSS
jgi:hypothetical protein